MRLTCPNCKAQYEIDGTAIPETGRDVQCSACGTTWYQHPESMALAPSGDDDPQEGSASATPAATPRIDQSVLDVLREEADRELSERRRSNAGGLETQGDLGLMARPRSARGERPPEPERSTPAAGDDEAPAPSRRNLLPDIEELSSTLQPGSAPRRMGSTETALPPTEQDERAGFRQGLSLVLLVAILLVGLYALAPMIARHVPALADPLAGYVALTDSLRAWVAENLRALIERVSALSR
ncbi:zinc-ribbon domain-containing protein [Pararhodobacter sp.]|uniref:zinc-ribbon domain-containing protein n=1 Tax=Pararhodobacter sp. TaxID=2127056 RepID=UPI002FDD4016